MKSSVIIFALAAIVVGCNDAGNDKANAPKTDSATTAAALNNSYALVHAILLVMGRCKKITIFFILRTPL